MGWKLVTGIALVGYIAYKCFFEEKKKPKPALRNDFYYDYDYDYGTYYESATPIQTVSEIREQLVTPPRIRIVYLQRRAIPLWHKFRKEINEVSSYTSQSWPEIRATIEGVDDGETLNKIEMYSIPKGHMELLEKNLEITSDMTRHEREAMENFLIKFASVPNVELSVNGLTLIEVFQILYHEKLYIEEYESMCKMKQYNLTGVTMQINEDKTECTLDVPGLAEKRPNILKNDVVYVRLQIEPTTQYSGLVKEVLKESIVIKGFDKRLLNYLAATNSKALLDIRFTSVRYSLYIQHLSLDLISSGTLDVMIPKDKTGRFKPYLAPQTIDDYSFLVNSNIRNNPEQIAAVLNILYRTNQSSAPYIIFGPPGTGKTATFVEAILQVKERIPYSHILVCAQNNGTCDQVASKLFSSGDCDKHEIIRLISSNRLEEADSAISEITSSSMDKISKYRIVVCTLITAGRMIESNMHMKTRLWKSRKSQTPHTFSHLFIDEAGQATECQSLVPIAGLLQQGGQVVLAGDPKQLGPVSPGKMSERFDLVYSFLERLMTPALLLPTADPVYQPEEDGKYDCRFITQLVKNYRSHEDILNISNKLFYDNKLEPQGITDDLCFAPLRIRLGKRKEKNSKVKGTPIVFHGVQGQEERDPKSLSMWNKEEIPIVIKYISQLFLCNIKNKVKQEDIGVIAPYFLQVQKIKQELRRRGWENIETGSTETFQGREKRVIIVSTVRSQPKKVGYYPIGFVKDPRRFNVIMTRAQSKLIVIGNPYALSQDECWRYLIKTALESNAYRGCEFSLKKSK